MRQVEREVGEETGVKGRIPLEVGNEDGSVQQDLTIGWHQSSRSWSRWRVET